MPLKMMYFTNEPQLALAAEQCSIDYVVIDLEIIGKIDRQSHKDTRISHHSIQDIAPVRQMLTKTQLMVRINPIHAESKDEIDSAIRQGADILMLPFFKTLQEVQTFLKLVKGRAKAYLLLETKEAEAILDDILQLSGIDAIHIGVNDLSLSKGYAFLFQPLLDESFAEMCRKIRAHGLPVGFGGIAQLKQGTLPAENIIAEHYHLGSSMVILARSFINLDATQPLGDLVQSLDQALRPIRDYEKFLDQQKPEYFSQNHQFVQNKIKEIINV